MAATTARPRGRLTPAQGRFVTSTATYDLFLGGVGAGKTTAGAVKAIPHILGGGLGMVVAPTFRMLRDATWRTALEIWRDCGLTWQVLRGDELRIEFVNGAEAIFRSAEDPDRLRGPNAAWAWLDEGAQCHPDTWPILIGRLRSEGRHGRAWVTTTPRGHNWVYDRFVVSATDETRLWKARTADNFFNPPEYVESLRSQYGAESDFARQELEAEFVEDVAGALLRYEWIEAAAGREPDYEADGEIAAGIDVAGPGEDGDETALCVRRGDDLLELAAWRGGEVRGEVLARLRQWRGLGLARVNVDVAGVGAYFAEHLRDAGYAVVPVNAGARPTGKRAAERFANLKAEMYWALRERFEEGSVAGLYDRATRAQLAGLRYELTSQGRVAIESKEAIRKKGGKSPDRAEALVLAFWVSPHAALAELVGVPARMRYG